MLDLICSIEGEVEAILIVGSLALVGVIINCFVIAIMNWRNNKKLEKISTDDRVSAKEISDVNRASVKEISAEDRDSQEQMSNKRNELEIVTSSRKEWLTRLKQNASKFLSQIVFFHQKEKDINFQEVFYYKYLIESDLNTTNALESNIVILMDEIIFSYLTASVQMKIFNKNNGMPIDIEDNKELFVMFQHKMPSLFLEDLDLQNKVAILQTARMFSQRYKYGADLLALKFNILYKIEWELIKMESLGESFDKLEVVNTHTDRFMEKYKTLIDHYEEYYNGRYLEEIDKNKKEQKSK